MRHVFFALILLVAPAWAEAPSSFSVSESTLAFKVVHKFHEVTSTSHQVEGKARLLPSGTLQVMARAPVASFESGNGNRDAHTLEAVEAGKFPLVEYKGMAEGVSLPSKFPATSKVHLNGVLTFHGVQKPQEVDATLRFTDANHFEVDAAFAISLEAFKVERPALMFVRVDDQLRAEAQLHLAREK